MQNNFYGVPVVPVPSSSAAVAPVPAAPSTPSLGLPLPGRRSSGPIAAGSLLVAPATPRPSSARRVDHAVLSPPFPKAGPVVPKTQSLPADVPKTQNILQSNGEIEVETVSYVEIGFSNAEVHNCCVGRVLSQNPPHIGVVHRSSQLLVLLC